MVSPIRIEARDIRKGYGEKKVLEGVSLILPAGYLIGLKGPSGIGKSTLARILSGIERPDGGTVLWNDSVSPPLGKIQLLFQEAEKALNPLKTVRTLLREVYQLRTRAIRREQLHTQFSSSDVLNPGRGEPISPTLDEAAALSQALESVGLDPTLLSFRPPQLSGGMVRRLLLARILLAQPDAILFDEPTGGLDHSLQATILRLIQRIHREHPFTGLIISHESAVLRFLCSETYTLCPGGTLT